MKTTAFVNHSFITLFGMNGDALEFVPQTFVGVEILIQRRYTQIFITSIKQTVVL